MLLNDIEAGMLREVLSDFQLPSSDIDRYFDGERTLESYLTTTLLLANIRNQQAYKTLLHITISWQTLETSHPSRLFIFNCSTLSLSYLHIHLNVKKS